MDFYKNNYFQSDEFRYLNQHIFKYKIIDIKKNNFFILRNSLYYNQKFTLGKSGMGTELRGFLEFFGQPTDFNSDNYQVELQQFLKETSIIIKRYNPGIVIFRAVDIKEKKQFETISKIFLNNGYSCRPWSTTTIDINPNNESLEVLSYNTRREIKRIKKLNISVDQINNFEEYIVYMKFFLRHMDMKTIQIKKNTLIF